MPLSARQLAEMVERARRKAPAVVAPPPQPAPAPSRPVRAQRAEPQPTARPTPPPMPGTLTLRPAAAATPEPPAPSAAPLPALVEAQVLPTQPAAAATALDDFPTGWRLERSSWHFHRRFHAVFKRPMEHGEYSHLLWQIRRGAAEQLDADCWRVTLPGGRTLPVRATAWRLITILPKNWQPLQSDAPSEASRLNSANGNSDLPPGGGQLLGCDA